MTGIQNFELHGYCPVEVTNSASLAELGGCFMPRSVLGRTAVCRVLAFSLSCSCLFLPLVLTQVQGELVHRADLLKNNTLPKCKFSVDQ